MHCVWALDSFAWFNKVQCDESLMWVVVRPAVADIAWHPQHKSEPVSLNKYQYHGLFGIICLFDAYVCLWPCGRLDGTLYSSLIGPVLPSCKWWPFECEMYSWGTRYSRVNLPNTWYYGVGFHKLQFLLITKPVSYLFGCNKIGQCLTHLVSPLTILVISTRTRVME